MLKEDLADSWASGWEPRRRTLRTPWGKGGPGRGSCHHRGPEAGVPQRVGGGAGTTKDTRKEGDGPAGKDSGFTLSEIRSGVVERCELTLLGVTEGVVSHSRTGDGGREVSLPRFPKQDGQVVRQEKCVCV